MWAEEFVAKLDEARITCLSKGCGQTREARLRSFKVSPDIHTRCNQLQENFTIVLLKLKTILFLKLITFPKERTRRSEAGMRCSEGEESCCLSSISVNLTSIGWDFIVAPEEIDFTYCRGHCDPFQLPNRIFVPQFANIRYVSLSPHICVKSMFFIWYMFVCEFTHRKMSHMKLMVTYLCSIIPKIAGKLPKILYFSRLFIKVYLNYLEMFRLNLCFCTFYVSFQYLTLTSFCKYFLI